MPKRIYASIIKINWKYHSLSKNFPYVICVDVTWDVIGKYCETILYKFKTKKEMDNLNIGDIVDYCDV